MDEADVMAKALGRWCNEHDRGYTRVAFPNGVHASGCPECLKDSPLALIDPEALWAATQQAKADRAERMPDEQAALRVLHDAYTRLKELGWRDAIYCPKDGTEFQVIEAGSTGIHNCAYLGEWPTGGWYINGEDPLRPILFRLQPSEAP